MMTLLTAYQQHSYTLVKDYVFIQGSKGKNRLNSELDMHVVLINMCSELGRYDEQTGTPIILEINKLK
jgi:hypothetical protein